MKRIEKRIRYQEHALQRLAERGISKDQVSRTLREPDAVRTAKRMGARRFEKAMSKRNRLVVIAEETANEFMVISTWMH
jgi:arginine repressor